MTDLFVVRNVLPDDRNFIFHSWMKSLRGGNWIYEEIVPDIFYRKYRDVISKIIAQSGTQINVACLPDDKDIILGYAVFNDDIIHWVFVKDMWKKHGIAKALVPQSIKRCSHLSTTGRFFKYKYKLEFNPFLGE